MILQEQRVIDYLEKKGRITTLTAMNDLGISRLSNVIHDLKDHGYNIVSSWETSNNRYGESCTYKVYRIGDDQNENQNTY